MARELPLYLPRVFRRVYQGFFLLFFLGSLALMTDEGIRRFPVRLLLELDPLSALSVLASSWLLPAGLATALVIVALTVLFGRAFCGWVCPLGTLHHLASWMTRGLRRGPHHQVNRWRPHFPPEVPAARRAARHRGRGHAVARSPRSRSRSPLARSPRPSSPPCRR